MNKRFAFLPAVAGASLLGLGTSASAALPAGVTDAIESIGADASSMATIVLLAIVAVFAIKFLRRGL